MSTTLRISIGIAIALPLLATTASSELLVGDLDTVGDELVTFDTDTNMEWLDLTATQGLSWNEAEASDFVLFDRFRHANVDEVEALFLNAGFLTVDNQNDPLNDPAALLLLDATGCTLFCGTVNELGRGFAELDATWITRPNYHRSGLGAGAAIVSLSTTNKDLQVASVGHFLVRDGPPLPPPPPGPSCGIGPELSLLIPPLLLAWRRRTRYPGPR